MSILLKLYFIFFKIGLFAFGGGYSILALLEKEVVAKTAWLSSVQLADIIAIAEMTPGPIFINTATFAGYKVAGIFGSIIATLASITPAICITLGVLYIAKKFNFKWIIECVKLVVIAMIALALISMAKLSIVDIKTFVIFGLAAYFATKPKISPIWLILGGGVLGIMLYAFF